MVEIGTKWQMAVRIKIGDMMRGEGRVISMREREKRRLEIVKRSISIMKEINIISMGIAIIIIIINILNVADNVKKC
jgi:hypothetical protein